MGESCLSDDGIKEERFASFKTQFLFDREHEII